MYKLRVLVLKTGTNLYGKLSRKCPLRHDIQRNISALYITGDKAKENYAILRPYMNFQDTFSDTTSIEESISARGWCVDMRTVSQKYKAYQEILKQINKLNEERDAVTNKLRDLTKTADRDTQVQIDALKEQGKALRSSLKSLKEKSYPIEEDFVHTFLNLPNSLHPNCPHENIEKIVYRSSAARCEEQTPSHLENTKLIRFLNNERYYMFGAAAEFDVYSMHALTNYFCQTGGFTQMANPDFVRQILLEASAVPEEEYHLVIGEQTPNNINPTYLVGGGAFESYLGAFTRLCIYPTILPLRLVCGGRSYEKVKMPEGRTANLYTATQTNAVQTFVATHRAREAEEQMEQILNLAVNFYKELGIHFRIVYADASVLTGAESLRAHIEVYSPAEKRYICVGQVSNYGDFISKRILFCIRMQKNYEFPHLVGGPVLYTTRLIGVLMENGLKLDDCKLLGSRSVPHKAINEFKELFK